MTYKVAHVREQGQDMVFVFVAQQPTEAQYADLQDCATSAGLAGQVVAVWKSGGRARFYGPKAWNPLFRSLSWEGVCASINKSLARG